MDFNQSTNINCIYCKHRWFWSCDAFPKGIPDDILNGENKHTKPTADQENDIVFEAIE